MTLSSNDENMTKLSITQLLLQPRDLITNKKIIDLAALVDNFKCWYKFCLVLISGYINVTYIYTVSANGCTNATTFSVVVSVTPGPTLSSTLAPAAICSNCINIGNIYRRCRSVCK